MQSAWEDAFAERPAWTWTFSFVINISGTCLPCWCKGYHSSLLSNLDPTGFWWPVSHYNSGDQRWICRNLSHLCH